MSVMGVDLGSTGVRAVAYRSGGAIVGEATARVAFRRSPDGTVILPIQPYREAVEASVRSAATSAHAAGEPVQALSFSAHGETVLPVDRTGAPVADGVAGMDPRGADAVAVVERRLGSAVVHHVTGQPLHAMFSVYKIADAGGEWADAHAYRCVTDHLLEVWGLEPVLDWGCAARTGGFDVNNVDWSDDLLSALGEHYPRVHRSRLSRTVASGQIVGGLARDAATHLGLDVGTLIVAGTHDQAATHLGVGAGPVVSFGSSDCITVGTPERPQGLDGTGFASYPIMPERWITLAGTAAGGWALEWYATLLSSEDGGLGTLLDHMSSTPPRAMVFPYLSGSSTLDNDPAARGVILGLDLDTTQGELTRALVESAGYELRRVVEALATAGIAVDSLRAAGGGGLDPSTLQLRADASGCVLQPTGGDAALRGAAMLAGDAVGIALPPVPVGQQIGPTANLETWHQHRRSIYDDAISSVLRLTRRITNLSTQLKGVSR